MYREGAVASTPLGWSGSIWSTQNRGMTVLIEFQGHAWSPRSSLGEKNNSVPKTTVSLRAFLSLLYIVAVCGVSHVVKREEFSLWLKPLHYKYSMKPVVTLWTVSNQMNQACRLYFPSAWHNAGNNVNREFSITISLASRTLFCLWWSGFPRAWDNLVYRSRQTTIYKRKNNFKLFLKTFCFSVTYIQKRNVWTSSPNSGP